MGIDRDLAEAVFSRIDTAAILPTVWPNVAYSGTVPFLQVWIMPTSTQAMGLGGSGSTRTGLIAVNVMMDQGVGMISAIDYAEEVAALFPCGLRLTQGTTMINFDEIPHIGTFFQTETAMGLPVTIPYKILK